jgi:hypothetical protein
MPPAFGPSWPAISRKVLPPRENAVYIFTGSGRRPGV